MDVLLLGAGGSARAVAFHAADQLDGGRLLISNRTAKSAVDLAREIQKAGRQALAIDEAELAVWAPKASLIINSTTKGQGGIRRLPDGMITLLEPYSALTSAHPPVFAESDLGKPEFRRKWAEAAQADIETNNQDSMSLARIIPPNVRFYDLIYHPEETVFLRHGRMTGHRTMNGKAMIVNQAAIAFCRRICSVELSLRGIDNSETYRQVLDAMYRAW
jgi:shikimate 5-dehydrogenase